jgi:hypothetical protein
MPGDELDAIVMWDGVRLDLGGVPSLPGRFDVDPESTADYEETAAKATKAEDMASQEFINKYEETAGRSSQNKLRTWHKCEFLRMQIANIQDWLRSGRWTSEETARLEQALTVKFVFRRDSRFRDEEDVVA